MKLFKRKNKDLENLGKLYRNLLDEFEKLMNENEELKKRVKILENMVPKYKPINVSCGETEPVKTVNMDDKQVINRCGTCEYYVLEGRLCSVGGNTSLNTECARYKEWKPKFTRCENEQNKIGGYE